MDVYGALADPVRRSLLEQLADRGGSRVVDLTAGRGISRPAVSRHLRVLSESGLVDATDVGRERHYAIDPRGLGEAIGFLSGLRDRAAPRPPVPAAALDALDLEVRRTVRERATTTTHIDTHTEETA